MKLEFVNHASFVVEVQGVRLICDPWMEGAIFNNGWDLLAKTRFDFDDFRHISHIWFSHEHPDHFFPPNLKQIPPQHRQNITVLFQATRDGQVAELCRKLGFKEVNELASNEWHDLAPDLEMLCRPVVSDSGDRDSWMCLKSENTTLLNLNDCEVNTRELARDIKRSVGQIDVLLTQFSYAGFAGNRDAIEARRAVAAQKLEAMMVQVDMLQPRFLIPFASFIWFCHEEDCYMNTGVNRIRSVFEHFQHLESTEVVILYPEDAWIVGEEHDSEKSIAAWESESAELGSRPRLKAAPVSRSQLLEASETCIAESRERINPLVAHVWAAGVVHPLRGKRQGSQRSWSGSLACFLFLRAEPVRLWIVDHESAYHLDSRRLQPVDLLRKLCDVEISAESLLNCFRFPWGCEALEINGRLHELYEHGRRSLLGYFKLGRMLHYGVQSLLAETSGVFFTRAKCQLSGRGAR